MLTDEHATASCSHRERGTIKLMDDMRIHVTDTGDGLKDHLRGIRSFRQGRQPDGSQGCNGIAERSGSDRDKDASPSARPTEVLRNSDLGAHSEKR